MCGNRTRQERAMTSGLMDMILAIFGISAAVADVSELNNDLGQTTITEEDKTASSSTLILLYILIGISVLRFVMGIVLRIGARKRDHKLVTAWFCSSIFLWIFQFVQFILKYIIGTFVLWSTIAGSLALVIRVAVMYVVYTFIQEIKDSETLPLLDSAEERI